MLRPLAIALLCFATGCGPAAPASRPPTRDVYPVGWKDLIRDHQTADSYAGHKVRLALTRIEYRVDGTDLNVWAGTRDVPPVLIFHLARPLPADAGDITLEAVCRGTQRDDITRTIRGHQFCVHFDDAITLP
jgi:hypothetical protein